MPSVLCRTFVVQEEVITNIYRDAVIADSPVVYYKLDETAGTIAVDQISAANGTYINIPTLSTNGIDNTAVTLNGSNQYINCPSTAWDFSGDFSIECWIKVLNNTVDSSIIQKYDGAGDKGWLMFLHADGTIGFDGRRGAGAYESVDSLRVVDDGEWHHVVLVRSGSTWLIYIDGSLNNFDGVGTGTMTTSVAMNVGRDRNTNNLYYGGSIDEVAIYEYALTLTQIQNHYQVGTDASNYELAIRNDGPISFWGLGD